MAACRLNAPPGRLAGWWSAVCLLGLASGVVREARAQPPVLRQTVPAAIRPGQTTEVMFQGEQLGGATTAWASVPAELTLLPPRDPAADNSSAAMVRITVPPDARPGVAAVRLATGRGVSNLCLLLVDPLSSVSETGVHATRESAQPIGLGIAVDGTCDAETSDWYRFTAAAGQTLQAEVYARRLGSALDPLLRLVDVTGRELAVSDDEPLIGVDSWIRHTFRAGGDYFLELRDSRYLGGPKHRYRLRLGDATEPLQPPLALAEPAPAEQEPNDQPESATRCTFPGAVAGQLQAPGDRDWFVFDARQGERLVIRGHTRSLGSPVDLFLRLTKADGALLAEVDDAGSEDAEVNFTAPADGTYRLMAEDLLRRGGANWVYRLTAETYQPGFSLAVDGEKFDAPQAGVFVVKVTANRRDFSGPITLSVEGVPGMALSDQVIAEGQKETTLRATLPPGLTAGQLAPLKLLGQAKIGEQDVRVSAGNLAALRGAFAGLPYPPAALDGALALGVGPVFPEYFQLAASEPAAPLPAGGGATKLRIMATRTSGFEDAIALEFQNLPAGVTAKPLALDKKQESVDIELTAAQPLAPGSYPVKLVGSAVFQNQPRRVVLEPALAVAPPSEPAPNADSAPDSPPPAKPAP